MINKLIIFVIFFITSLPSIQSLVNPCQKYMKDIKIDKDIKNIYSDCIFKLNTNDVYIQSYESDYIFCCRIHPLKNVFFGKRNTF